MSEIKKDDTVQKLRGENERFKKRVIDLEKDLDGTRKEILKLNKKIGELAAHAADAPMAGEIIVKRDALRDLIVAIWYRKMDRLQRRFAQKHLASLLGKDYEKVNVGKWIEEAVDG